MAERETPGEPAIATEAGFGPPLQNPFTCEIGRGVGGTPQAEGVVFTDVRPRTGSYVVSDEISAKQKRRLEMKRPTINITPIERAGRVFVGLVGAIGGLILLASGGGPVVVVLEVLLVLAGLDLVATGALGHCPLYRKLGYTPASLKGAHR